MGRRDDSGDADTASQGNSAPAPAPVDGSARASRSRRPRRPWRRRRHAVGSAALLTMVAPHARTPPATSCRPSARLRELAARASNPEYQKMLQFRQKLVV